MIYQTESVKFMTLAMPYALEEAFIKRLSYTYTHSRGMPFPEDEGPRWHGNLWL